MTPNRFLTLHPHLVRWARRNAERALHRCEFLVADLEAAVAAIGQPQDTEGLSHYRRQLHREYNHQAQIAELSLARLEDLGPAVGTTYALAELRARGGEIAKRWERVLGTWEALAGATVRRLEAARE